MEDFCYIGNELELFAAATVWKAYFRRHIEAYLGDDVLEVGAGLGGTTKLLCHPGDQRGAWVCLEPDAGLARGLELAISGGELPGHCRVLMGTLDQVPPDSRFNTVLYIDVLEHIADDRGELSRAAGCLKPGGHLVVLGPAHPRLFSPFDVAIGHHRRYTKAMLRALTPEGLILVRSRYLDSIGLLASLGNRLFLRRPCPARGRSPSGTRSWSGAPGSSIPCSATRWASRSWASGKNRLRASPTRRAHDRTSSVR